MKPEYKTFEFKITEADAAQGIIRGYASTFGNIDLGDDVVDEGAFKKTLQESKGLVPILADHDPTKQIGWNLRAMEDSKGLFFEGQLDIANNKTAMERYSLAQKALEIGAKFGISIGYGTIKAIPDKERPSVRRLKELKLYEYSMVTFPMNTMAMVTAAKAWKECLTKSDLAEKIIEEAKARGFTIDELCEALRTRGAAEEMDPAIIGQSLKNLLETITST